MELGIFVGQPGDGPRTRQAAGVHSIRSQAVTPKLDIRQNTFSHRVVGPWNSLPDKVKRVLTKAGSYEWARGRRTGGSQ